MKLLNVIVPCFEIRKDIRCANEPSLSNVRIFREISPYFYHSHNKNVVIAYVVERNLKSCYDEKRFTHNF